MNGPITPDVKLQPSLFKMLLSYLPHLQSPNKCPKCDTFFFLFCINIYISNINSANFAAPFECFFFNI